MGGDVLTVLEITSDLLRQSEDLLAALTSSQHDLESILARLDSEE